MNEWEFGIVFDVMIRFMVFPHFLHQQKEHFHMSKQKQSCQNSDC